MSVITLTQSIAPVTVQVIPAGLPGPCRGGVALRVTVFGEPTTFTLTDTEAQQLIDEIRHLVASQNSSAGPDRGKTLSGA